MWTCPLDYSPYINLLVVCIVYEDARDEALDITELSMRMHVMKPMI